MVINFDSELRKIFGDKFEGCTQEGDELVEYRLKPGRIASSGELSAAGTLSKSTRAEIDELKARLDKVGIIK